MEKILIGKHVKFYRILSWYLPFYLDPTTLSQVRHISGIRHFSFEIKKTYIELKFNNKNIYHVILFIEYILNSSMNFRIIYITNCDGRVLFEISNLSTESDFDAIHTYLRDLTIINIFLNEVTDSEELLSRIYYVEKSYRDDLFYYYKELYRIDL